MKKEGWFQEPLLNITLNLDDGDMNQGLFLALKINIACPVEFQHLDSFSPGLNYFQGLNS